MELELEGVIEYIGPIQEIPSKRGGEPFRKIEFVLDDSTRDKYTGDVSFVNYVQFFLSEKKFGLIQGYQRGDVVKVKFYPNGRKYEKNGETRYFTTLNAYAIETIRKTEKVIPQLQKESDGLPF